MYGHGGSMPDSFIVCLWIFQTVVQVGVLTSHGFEQSDIYQQAHNFEDAQIAAAWRGKKFAPNVLVESILVSC